MAEETVNNVAGGEGSVETTDRGLFDFMGKKKEEEKPQEGVAIAAEFDDKVKIEEEHKKEEGEKKKLHRSDSSSSSSSDEEGGEGKEEKKKKKKGKKGLKEKIEEKLGGEKKEEETAVPVDKVEEPVAVVQPATAEEPAEKKGFLEKIKEKLPGQHKKTEEVPPPPPPQVAECYAADDQHHEGSTKEKKGIFEKIKEKLPGYNSKTEEEKEKEKIASVIYNAIPMAQEKEKIASVIYNAIPMAHFTTDPLEDMIADGRIAIRSPFYHGPAEILTIDLDLAQTIIAQKLRTVYENEVTVRAFYTVFVNGCNAMADYAVGALYNRLRFILEWTLPSARSTRMNSRCPVPSKWEFPTWLASTLSAIGPCRIEDGPRDTLITYASSAATMAHHGRTNPVVYSEGDHNRLLEALKELGVSCSPVHFAGIEGSYFPTIEPVMNNQTWTFLGTVHSSHYENEDIARIAFFTNALGATPFESIGTTIGYIDNEAALNAIAAVPAPPEIPAGQAADSAACAVAAYFHVNYFGIKPAVAAQGSTPAVPRGCYII